MDVYGDMDSLNNTEQKVSRAIVDQWLQEMDSEMEKLSCPWMASPRLKIILTRTACKVHGKDKSVGKCNTYENLQALILQCITLPKS